MKFLGIETSCDETAASIVEDGTKIVSNVVASSQEIHIKSGGIIPESAAREQVKYIIPVVNKAITQAFDKLLSSKISHLRSDIDAIAVTIGPGLIGSLLVGVETAKTLAYVWNKPIVPVNHLIAHIYANWLDFRKTDNRRQKPEFPLIPLIVSGGHTELLLMKAHGQYTWLGGTRDDAAGEAFDKIARLLGLGYPGGPAIAATAAKLITHNSQPITHLPRPMIDSEDFDFSFSGLKTAVIRELKCFNVLKQWNKKQISQFAYEVQEAITDVLVEKTIKAAEKYQVKSLLLAGGVAANERLREKLSSNIHHLSSKFFVPPKNLCTDNAAGVAVAAFFNFQPVPWQKIRVNPGLTIEDEV